VIPVQNLKLKFAGHSVFGEALAGHWDMKITKLADIDRDFESFEALPVRAQLAGLRSESQAQLLPPARSNARWRNSTFIAHGSH